MEKILYPTHPVGCIITRPSGCGKSVFLTNINLYFINECNKIFIYSPSLHQDLYQKLNKCCSKYIAIHIILVILKEEDIDEVINEIVSKRDFEKSNTESVIETYESIEELKFLQENEDEVTFILDNLNEKGQNDSRVQAMFKRSRHNNLSIFLMSQDYYELPKKMIRANGNIYYIFKTKNFRGVQNLHQDKASMDMTLDEFEYLTSTCWNHKYQQLTFDMTKDRYQGRYRCGLNSIFVPSSSPF